MLYSVAIEKQVTIHFTIWISLAFFKPSVNLLVVIWKDRKLNVDIRLQWTEEIDLKPDTFTY